MADLATLRSAHAAGLARAVGREVVLVHVALALFGPDGVEALPLVEHAERADAHDLRLTALEQSAAMNARQIAGNDVERANLLGRTTVDALAGLEDHGAHGPLLEGLEGGGNVAAPCSALLVAELVLLDLSLEISTLPMRRACRRL